MQDDAMKEMDQERAEFEALVAAFSSTPRSLRLLRYIGDNYFSGTLTELCEFSIATEVFGRPKSQFNPAEDAIARAETHRLRKRLNDYYREEGKNHTLHFSQPLFLFLSMRMTRQHGWKTLPTQKRRIPGATKFRWGY
jgi:hypothetical protein